jgi:hypothetical protein
MGQISTESKTRTVDVSQFKPIVRPVRGKTIDINSKREITSFKDLINYGNSRRKEK